MNGTESVVCENCFKDKRLREVIRDKNTRGNCSWCGSQEVYIIPIIEISDLFHDVASIYEQTDDISDEYIDFLLQEDWEIFSERIEEDPSDLMHRLTIEILEAGVDRHHDVDEPDYDSFFKRKSLWLEEEWEYKIISLLTKNNTASEEEQPIEEHGNDLSDSLEAASEDLSTKYEEGNILFRARIHNERSRTEKFTLTELGTPSADRARSGRANRKGEPVLYLASNTETALSEVRPWKGAAVAVAEIKIKWELGIINLLNFKLLESPFFEEDIEWKIQLSHLLYTFAEELSRPIIPGEEDKLYLPSQHLCDLIRKFNYDGVIYPSTMGAGYNVVLFNPESAEPLNVKYYKIREIPYKFDELGKYENIYEEWHYDYLTNK